MYPDHRIGHALIEELHSIRTTRRPSKRNDARS